MPDSVKRQELSASEWLSRVKDTDRRGEFLAAYDLTVQALQAHPNDLSLQHRAVLALARSGATQHARALFDSYNLAQRPEEDIAALGARLAKDHAMTAGGRERAARAATAAKLYEAIFKRTGGYYPGINAATMHLVAGDSKRAVNLAHKVLTTCKQIGKEPSSEAYFVAATQAEAALLLGDLKAFKDAVKHAATIHGGDFAAIAGTRKQLRLICGIKGIDPSILVPLQSPSVVHYVGHLIAPQGTSGRFSAKSEAGIAKAISAYLAKRNVGYGYGSLACGADILFGEALIKRGAELHVVLPFNQDEFKKISVLRGGREWTYRFDRCLQHATSVNYATEDSYMNDDLLFSYASRFAMGLALLRASHLDTEVEQVAVWDGKTARGKVGTAADVTFWRSMKLKSHVIPCSDQTASVGTEPLESTPQKLPALKRQIRAMIFGDMKGFSKLREPQLPVFLDKVMGKLSSILEGYGRDIMYRNTWGDGVFLVLRDAPVAARCALGLQEAMNETGLERIGLPTYLGLRIGAHLGPVFKGYDPIVKRPFFFGSQVTRAARLEPATPEGNVYVTEPFAACLALARNDAFTCEYVGQMPAAKDYGIMRMYVLKRKDQEE